MPSTRTPGHAVAGRSVRDRRGELLVRRDRDRPPVVLAEQDRGARRTPRRGSRPRGSRPRRRSRPRSTRASTPCSRRACAPIAHPTAWTICVATGTQIGANRVRDRVVRTAVPRPAVVLEVLDDVDASHDRRRELAERREHEVVGTERERAADLRRLLALERRVDGELALALERPALAVEPPRHGSSAAGARGARSSDSPTSTSPTAVPSGASEPNDRGVGGRDLGHAGRPPACAGERGQGSIYTLERRGPVGRAPRLPAARGVPAARAGALGAAHRRRASVARPAEVPARR